MKRAFTLVEVLISIIIVGVLVSILLTALGSVREHARKVECAANLRSLGLATSMYLDAGDGLLPRATSWGEPSELLEPWSSLGRHLDAPFPKAQPGGGFAYAAPWAFPSDEEIAPESAFSYEYVPRSFFDAGMARRTVSKFFSDDPRYSLYIDDLPFHVGLRNSLRADFSVREFVRPADQKPWAVASLRHSGMIHPAPGGSCNERDFSPQRPRGSARGVAFS